MHSEHPLHRPPRSADKRARRGWTLLRDALSGHERDYTRGSVDRAVMLLAIPMMLEMAMESVFSIVDIFFVARLGAPAVAAVGLTETVLTLLYAVAIGLGYGVTALVARRIGEHAPDAAATVAGQTLWIGVAVSALVAVIGLTFAPEILALMGGDAEVVAGGTAYIAWMLGGSLTIVLLFLVTAVFRGAGAAAIAMRVLLIANAINIVLDPCLIYGIGPFPELGLTGAAIATNIGRGIGGLYGLYMLVADDGQLRVRVRHLAVEARVMLRLLRVSAGGVLQMIIATSSYIVLMRIVAEYGSTAVAGYTIAIRIVLFTLMPSWGLSNAAATLVGQNLGAAEPARAESSVWRATKYNFVFLVAIAFVFIAFAEPLVGIFSREPEVVRYAADCLRIVSYGYGFYAIGMIVIQAFNGAGDTGTPTWINFVFFWLLQLPLAYALAGAAKLGPHGVFWAIAIAESLMAIGALVLFRRGRWKARKV